MTALQAMNDRQTENAIVVTFLNWSEHVLYDSRKAPHDIPLALADYPVESVNVIDSNLTIIEI